MLAAEGSSSSRLDHPDLVNLGNLYSEGELGILPPPTNSGCFQVLGKRRLALICPVNCRSIFILQVDMLSKAAGTSLLPQAKSIIVGCVFSASLSKSCMHVVTIVSATPRSHSYNYPPHLIENELKRTCLIPVNSQMCNPYIPP